MKTRVFLSFITIFFFSSSLLAQFHIGVKGGANIIKIDGKSFKDEFRFGYHLGGFIELGLGNKFSLHPEVLFNQYATTVDSNFNHIYQNVFKSNDIKLNYLSIPLVLNYKLIGPVSLQAGPQFGILIDKNKNLLQNGASAFKNGDLSMLGGAQVKLAALRITGRYAIGLSNINDIDNQDKWTFQGFQLSLGLAL
jgi:hypothetical protein